MCGTPKRPKMIINQLPSEEDPSVIEAMAKEKELARRRRGRASTLLTGSRGLLQQENIRKTTASGGGI